jgi:hypothetical protein
VYFGCAKALFSYQEYEENTISFEALFDEKKERYE